MVDVDASLRDGPPREITKADLCPNPSCRHLLEFHDASGCDVVVERGPEARAFQMPEVRFRRCRCRLNERGSQSL